jgi:hypothetical protein
MGALMRYWPVLLRRFKRESKANDALFRAVIMSGMSDQKSGSAERWLNESGLTVRDRLHADKLKQKKQWALRKVRWPGFWQWVFRSPLALS